MKTTKSRSRRQFLLAAGLGSAGVAAAVATRSRTAATAPAAPVDGKKQGYHVSEHILKYYKTTEV